MKTFKETGKYNHLSEYEKRRLIDLGHRHNFAKRPFESLNEDELIEYYLLINKSNNPTLTPTP